MSNTKFNIEILFRVVSFLILTVYILYMNYLKNKNYRNIKLKDVIIHLVLLLIFAFNIFDVFLS